MDWVMILRSVNRIALPLGGLLLVLLCLVWLSRQKIAPPPEAYLINVINRDRILLKRWENSVGRSPRCDVVLNYPTVSRMHAVIARRQGAWILVDTGSRTGTTQNQTAVEKRATLRQGDTIAFGSAVYLFYDSREEHPAGQPAQSAPQETAPLYDPDV
ncbi:MAG: FHA domain-containing protein [Oscillospiraceae bacterium]|jgi:hypothetical protein|nr:FHA domain-containing protein [Oscillospiraceae bacterium]